MVAYQHTEPCPPMLYCSHLTLRTVHRLQSTSSVLFLMDWGFQWIWILNQYQKYISLNPVCKHLHLSLPSKLLLHLPLLSLSSPELLLREQPNARFLTPIDYYIESIQIDVIIRYNKTATKTLTCSAHLCIGLKILISPNRISWRLAIFASDCPFSAKTQ